ncbi:helix-turn-helix transcriptional regulator [Pseudomonas sp. GM_Psu_2]|uniref:helix-turn-helix domain-containing protein n=1 Tax=unclassified Pseudomonas TaxID=196821 RepID=UPI002269CDA1|nr:helix-turn-helix transcriptional regulator [Pseudomonas sp. GM_Psu_2]
MLPMPSDPEFPKKLAIARKANGYSQIELSKEAGFGEGQISNYERGLNKPSKASWKQLQVALFKNAAVTDLDSVWRAGLKEQAQTNEPDLSSVTLANATVEQLVAALKDRGFESVTLTS